MHTMNASWLTVWVIVFTGFFTSLYWYLVLPFEKAKRLSLMTALIGSLAFTFVLFNGIPRLGLAGGLVIILMWLWPATIVWIKRDYFLNLDQRILVGLQIFRLIGAFFILEMFKGNIPESFALPAGIGDIIVGCLSAILFLSYKKIPRWGVQLVLVLGLIDFAMAFLFGFFSLPGPFQLFAKGFDNQVNLFPTGLIPFYLVPYAIVYHVLSFINLQRKSLEGK